jgi:hypothetical protein
MSIGTIILIILVIALLGGFSGIGTPARNDEVHFPSFLIASLIDDAASS